MGIIYFAYGSNMDFNRLNEREISFEFIGLGILEDYELKFNKIASKKSGVGYANIVSQKGSKVEGLLFSIDNIELLDQFEGFPSHYKKEILKIHYLGNLIDAIVYVASIKWVSNSLKPERAYLNRLLAAKDFLSKEYLSLLEITETID
ncbi:gamma-glutamylcyclotransferase family protein [Daejeonella sp.]|jgi:gamma-glutamylcyclotransferase|uniref:gamma-glutamylcyclotransferase family protein n=1 Tax=Daejeonella sp. TaxID=2805397 RepID=UPI0037834BC1